MAMDISELKSKKIAELNLIAKELNIAGYSDLRKQELIFKVLEAQATRDGKPAKTPGFTAGLFLLLHGSRHRNRTPSRHQ